MSLPSQLPLSNLKPGQRATLFPSLGYYDLKRHCWRSWVHGRVFIDGQIPLGTRLLLHGLKKAMRATPEQVASETFQHRIDGFLAAPGRRRRIVLQIAGQHCGYRRRTRRNGAFYGTLTLPEEVFQHSPSALNGRSLVTAIELLRSSDELGVDQGIAGQLHVVSPHGVSVISDIDDTIKMTEATSRSEMLANTFCTLRSGRRHVATLSQLAITRLRLPLCLQQSLAVVRAVGRIVRCQRISWRQHALEIFSRA